MRGGCRRHKFSRICKWWIALKHILCLVCIFYYRNGQFEKFVFVIMSTRVNIRLIARAPSILECSWNHENFGSLAKLTWSPSGLHFLCKKPEVFMIIWTDQKFNSTLWHLSKEECGGSEIECLSILAIEPRRVGTVLCPRARHIILCLVLIQSRETRPDMTVS